MEQSEPKGNSKKKTLLLILALLLVLGGFGTYFTIHLANARTIEQQLSLGNHYYKEHKYKEAIIAYKKVLDIDENNVEARIGLAKSYLALKRYKPAVKVLTAGIKLIPKEPQFYLSLSDAKLVMNDILAAIQELDDGFSKTKDAEIQTRLNEMKQKIVIVSDKDEVQVGQETHLKAIYKKSADEKGTLVKATWSLIPNELGSLSEKSSEETDFTAKKSGDETVVANVGSISEEKNLTVRKHVLSKLEIHSPSTSVTVGKRISLKAVGKDANGKTMDVDPIWSIESGVGDLSSEHGDQVTFTSERTGNTKIVAQDNGKEDSVELSVVDEQTNDEEISGQDIQNQTSANETSTNAEQTASTSSGTSSEQPQTSKTSHQSATQSSVNPVNHAITDNQSDVLTKPEQVDVGNKITSEPAQQQQQEPAQNQQQEPTQNNQQEPSAPAATEQPKTYALTTSVDGKGHVAQNPNTARYDENTSVTLTAEADDAGWVFDHWEGEKTGTENPVSVTVNKDANVKAVFIQLGIVSGTITDAQTGDSVSQATIRLVKDNQPIKEVTTDGNGNYNLTGIRPSDYTLEVVKVGYITKSSEITVKEAETVAHNESIQKQGTAEFSVVLTWGETPDDLDSHLTGPKADNPLERFHIYYGNKQYASDLNGDEMVYAKLDRDDTDGFGPETITSFIKTNGVFRYYVHDFGENSEMDLPQSQAKVELYQQNRLVKTFNVPENQQGFVWHVFEIDQDGNVIPINKIDNDSANDNPQYEETSDDGSDADQEDVGDSSDLEDEDNSSTIEDDSDSSSIEPAEQNSGDSGSSTSSSQEDASSFTAPSEDDHNVDGSATVPATVGNDASTDTAAANSDISSSSSSTDSSSNADSSAGSSQQ
jgi:uncharacterized protein YfaP (DUF2135 family)